MSKKFKFDWDKVKDNIKKDEQQKKSYGDSRFWKLKIGDDKKGQALIRFLPDKNQIPYKQYFSHWFDFERPGSGVSKWTENCATTIKMDCPICDKNRELWNSAYEVDKNLARDRKRRNHYVANILVLKDDASPENDGKVFLFDFGPQIFEKYRKAMFGPDEDDPEYDENEPADTFVPCDFEEGRNFHLRSTLKKGGGQKKWNTYESSKFLKESRIYDELDDEEWEKIVEVTWDKTVDLAEWSQPNKYPSVEKVISTLSHVLNVKQNSPMKEDVETENDVNDLDYGNTIETASDVEPPVDMSDDDFINKALER